MTNNNNTVSYPYAYGLLNGGLQHFAETFETNARVRGFDVDSELMQYMREELKKLSDKAHDKGVAHNKEYGF